MDEQQHEWTSPEDTSETDSAVGHDYAYLTQSLRSSLLESVEENGRGYHRYKSILGDSWAIPDDEREQERLDLQHEMFLRTFGRKLHLCPLPEDVKHVLDLGCGTGIWAIDFADEHSESEIIGTDLSAIQPQFVPPNCKFEIDDFNCEWTFQQKFDFIHARAMVGTTKDFPAMIRQAFKSLNPGGWLEMTDVLMPFRCDDGTMDGTALETWLNRQVECCEKLGIDLDAPCKFKQWMIDQGFEGVTEVQFKWPVGAWPRDKSSKILGKMTQVNFLAGIEGFTMRLWTGVLGMKPEEVQVFLARVRRDIMNPKVHSYWPIYSVFGQKPVGSGETATG
ncbi:uncharacterized protein MYCFIDRAFT_88627 [Pseudocercospora fijiensis CIRAD86]|uniref:Methyltransferase domain-containing protein n=1 Tax=Pseudocercospora fijiensis (strain CIRAD86) TaxID=383855 RepID=M3AK18_PSEFD|nr:uncharacterized protein MYCFIDRAFT_88627 [Pseudocercospora fijiensis CIRAD86]EME84921.1 hypothetical protein MYCFIDRAFT_88627 [Pseudocercospora fijiensis CIRAD86]